MANFKNIVVEIKATPNDLNKGVVCITNNKNGRQSSEAIRKMVIDNIGLTNRLLEVPLDKTNRAFIDIAEGNKLMINDTEGNIFNYELKDGNWVFVGKDPR